MPRSTKKARAEIPQGLRFNVFRRDNFTCRYCGKQSPEIVLHLDHVKPVAEGGVDTEENFVTSCVDCNQGKSAKTGVAPPENAKRQSTGLVGMFGHIFDEKGRVHWQFQIDRQITDETYAVMTFSWFSGEAWSTEILPLATLLGERCKLYQTAKEMNFHFERLSRAERWDDAEESAA